MKKVEIIPAILPKDFAELQEKVGLVKGLVRTVQVDITDGQFTQHPSWPYRKPDQNFLRILSQDEGLPHWQELDYEFDLMVNFKKPEDAENWILAGASRLVFHAESKGNIREMMELVKAVEIGLALGLDTPIDVIEDYKDMAVFVQCMGIDRIGFQGQEFDPRVLEKTRSIRAKYPDMPISVDGGVSLDNAPSLIQAGATRLVIGSAIFGADNPIEAIRKFQRM